MVITSARRFTSRLEFKYSRPILVLIVLGVPGMLALTLALAWGSFFLLSTDGPGDSSRANAALAGALSVGFGWLFLSGLRSWRSFFIAYSLDHAGVQVGSTTPAVILAWSTLQTARYRRLLGQIELRFKDYPRPVILNNVEFDVERRSLKAALELIEAEFGKPVQRSLF